MNSMTLDKLQYDELKDIVKSYCVSGLGKQLLDKLMPSSSLKVVKTRLNETTEARAILDAEGHVPFLGVSNIEHLMTKLEKGMILDPSELVSMSDFLRGCRNIKKFMLDKEFLHQFFHLMPIPWLNLKALKKKLILQSKPIVWIRLLVAN